MWREVVYFTRPRGRAGLSFRAGCWRLLKGRALVDWLPSVRGLAFFGYLHTLLLLELQMLALLALVSEVGATCARRGESGARR
ncbi:unnamed protein product [Amoebophrya sp. A120]|nr:unnamed protein product [Amoebophrya sp. A120]|eukprot:GSA120T00018227001.1